MKITRDNVLDGFMTKYDVEECETISAIIFRDKIQRPTLSQEEIIEQIAKSYENKTYEKRPCVIECFFRNGEMKSYDIPHNCWSYNEQYGISVTEDGKNFFLPIWEGGLFCFETETGKKLWRLPIGGVTTIIPYKDLIFACRANSGIEIFSVKDGMRVNRLPCLDANLKMKKLGKEHFMYGPKRGKYLILRSEDLSIVQIIDSNKMIADALIKYPNTRPWIGPITFEEGNILFKCWIDYKERKDQTYEIFKVPFKHK